MTNTQNNKTNIKTAKMKERIRHLATIAMLLVVALCATSCSDDDGDGGGTQGFIVGTWRDSFSTGYTEYVFNSNGTGTEREYDAADGGYGTTHAFDYTYDGTSGSLYISYDDGYSEFYTVEWLSSSSVRLTARGETDIIELTRL